ncbi:hypothetical protein GVO57_05585 [Sphingomonas changnyeongensis]|uniref:Prolyl 3,4-dihydroxylase TPA1/OFD1 N-terminal domain-containing protein n=1 Tax=Sphingomonas changnyeongensis TaxID=2698679 RepID=A0A7Z2S7J8_9SPHN|nr:2OG-Fe(II) oxygenase family protein [Sphingomonas changnyeongensis]QHL90406.1 hypothetical protein GVO57_05585 [Sphingomonas changnyeongensis]
MGQSQPILKLNPQLDLPGLKTAFARDRRVQIRDFLTRDSAQSIAQLLAEETPWGLSWQAGADGPHKLRREQMAGLDPSTMQRTWQKLNHAAATGQFAFIYSQYQMYDAVRDGWSASAAHDGIVAALNGPDIIALMRDVTGIGQISWCDAQATHFGAGQFLTVHQDVNENEDWLVAYVLNLCTHEWHPDWGGYLNFFNDDGDIVAGFRPRFNALNIFAVPQHHHVSYLPGYAPAGRFAITGWFRGR